MRTESVPLQTLERILLYGIAYLLWLVNGVVGVAVVIQLRSTVNVLWVALGGDRYSLGLVTQVSVILGGIGALVYVMFLESSFRESVTRRKQKPEPSDVVSARVSTVPSRFTQWLTCVGLDVLLRCFVIATAIPLGLLAVLLIISEVGWRVMR